MPYYPTLEEDIRRAKQILAQGKGDQHSVGVIYGADNYAAYMLLESFVDAIEEYKRKEKQKESIGLQNSNLPLDV